MMKKKKYSVGEVRVAKEQRSFEKIRRPRVCRGIDAKIVSVSSSVSSSLLRIFLLERKTYPGKGGSRAVRL